MLCSLHHNYSPKIESVVFGIWKWLDRMNKPQLGASANLRCLIVPSPKPWMWFLRGPEWEGRGNWSLSTEPLALRRHQRP